MQHAENPNLMPPSAQHPLFPCALLVLSPEGLASAGVGLAQAVPQPRVLASRCPRSRGWAHAVQAPSSLLSLRGQI